MTDHNNIGQEEQPGKHLPEALLLAYMEGKLTGDELHEVEAWLATESMESDALEGLQDFAPQEAKAFTSKLNRQLQQELSKKKKRRNRRSIMDQKWSWIAIVVVILLTAAGFAVVWLMKH